MSSMCSALNCSSVMHFLDATGLAVALRRSRAQHLARLRDELDLPTIVLPYLFVRDHGLRVTRMVAEALAAELDS